MPQGSHLGPLLFILYVNEITDNLHNTNSLLYADDTKIFKIIRNKDDCVLMQQDLMKFEAFCKENSLYLNTDKCYTVTFSRKLNPIIFDYSLNDRVLTRVNEIRDLGVTLDSKLTFIPHIDKMLNKAFKQLGFILRVSKPFKNSLTYKLLYNSYVRSHLEFASVVWQPTFNTHADRIERVQHKFVKALDFRTGRTYVDYDTSVKHHNIPLLSHRRDLFDVTFLYKLINNLIDAPKLLQNITFRIPRLRERSCRKKYLFSYPPAKTCYGSNTFTRRSCRIYDDKLHEVDIFSLNLRTFKKDTLNILSIDS